MRAFFLKRLGWGAGALWGGGGGLAKKLYLGPIDYSVRGPQNSLFEDQLLIEG